MIVDAAVVKFGSLKVWNWIVQSYKSSQNHNMSSIHHFQIWATICCHVSTSQWKIKDCQSPVKSSQWWSNKKGLRCNYWYIKISLQIWTIRMQGLNWNFSQDLVVANYLDIFR